MKYILFSVALLLATVATAQNLAFTVSGAYQLKNNNPGAAIGLEYQTAKSTVGFQSGFDFPATTIIETVAAGNYGTGAVPILIKAEQTSRINTYYVKYNYLFLNEIDDTFFPYVTLGIGGVNFNNTTNVVLNYDVSKYSHPFLLDKNDNNVFNIFAVGGLGAQYSLGNVKVFGEARYHLPLSKPRDPIYTYGKIDTYPVQSAFINFNLGLMYAFSIGGR